TQYDAVKALEHEIDEVLGLGSYLDYLKNGISADPFPMDLFSWSAPGTRNLTSFANRYFSIDGGVTDIIGFNSNTGGDLGDWPIADCLHVQGASCRGQVGDVSPTSPEGIALDVIGYNLILQGLTVTGRLQIDGTDIFLSSARCSGNGICAFRGRVPPVAVKSGHQLFSTVTPALVHGYLVSDGPPPTTTTPSTTTTTLHPRRGTTTATT